MTEPVRQQPVIAAGVMPIAGLDAGVGPDAGVDVRVDPAAGVMPASGTVAAAAIPVVPDDAVMIREIDQDRRRERYLLRAALVAFVVIAIALSIRLVWG